MKEYVKIIKALELQHNNPQTKKGIDKTMADSDNGKIRSISEHVACMILAMLTANRPYEPIKQHLSQLENIFMNYDADKLMNADPEQLIKSVKSIRCGNMRIKFQMYALKHNISYLRQMQQEHGSIDAYYHSMTKYDLVKTLDNNLKEMSATLISEYLPSVGIDLPKPDRHIQRILGSERLGFSSRKMASIQGCYEVIHDFAVATSEHERYIDVILWSYCAEGEKNICCASPRCEKCVISEYCNYKGKSEK